MTMELEKHFMKIWTLGGVFATCYERLAWDMIPSTIFLPRELVAFQHQLMQIMRLDEEINEEEARGYRL